MIPFAKRAERTAGGDPRFTEERQRSRGYAGGALAAANAVKRGFLLQADAAALIAAAEASNVLK
jgi:hypothetical protein